MMDAGLVVTGRKADAPNRGSATVVERPAHPWFLGVQFHPELLSRPFSPHPVFVSLLKAARAHHDQTRHDRAQRGF